MSLAVAVRLIYNSFLNSDKLRVLFKSLKLLKYLLELNYEIKVDYSEGNTLQRANYQGSAVSR